MKITKLLLLAGFCLTVLVSGCRKKDCEGNKVCENGDCSDGDCVCTDGYFGEFCELSIVAGFPGEYTGTVDYIAADTSYTDTATYTITLVNAANLAFSFGPVSTGADVVACEGGSGALLILPQALSNGDFSGSLSPVILSSSDQLELKLSGSWQTAARTYTVSGLMTLKP